MKRSFSRPLIAATVTVTVIAFALTAYYWPVDTRPGPLSPEISLEASQRQIREAEAQLREAEAQLREAEAQRREAEVQRLQEEAPRAAYRRANGGCELGTHRVCWTAGASGTNEPTINLGCHCEPNDAPQAAPPQQLAKEGQRRGKQQTQRSVAASLNRAQPVQQATQEAGMSFPTPEAGEANVKLVAGHVAFTDLKRMIKNKPEIIDVWLSAILSKNGAMAESW